jgi:DNA-binding CsgD family transcriptional regulator
MIGRDNERAEFQDQLEGVLAGRGSVVLVSGEAGIGKTTLAEAVAETARARGLLTAWGRCREDRGMPALWPWIQILHDLGVTAPGGGIDAAGPAAPDLVALLSGVGGDPDDEQDAELTASRRFRLLAGTARMLGALDRPALVVLDDLHRADLATWELLAQVADAPPAGLLVLGTLRDAEVEPGSLAGRSLAEIVAGPASRLLGLAPLSADEARRLVARLQRRAVEPRTDVEAVLHRAAGNPFFLEQLVLVQGDGRCGTGLPLTIRETVRDRVDRLPPATASMLRRAAVLGRELPEGELRWLVDTDAARLAELTEPAVRSGLLERREGRLRFRHVLVRDALYEHLDPRARRDAHERLAGRPMTEPIQVGDLIDRAHHTLEACRLGADLDLAGAASRAAGAAASVLDLTGAAVWADHAVEAGPGGRAPAGLLLASGEAHLRAGHAGRARERFEAAWRAADASGDANAAAEAALGVGRCVVTAGSVDHGLVRLLEEAAEQLPRVHDQRARLVARRGVEIYWNDQPEARRLTAEAFALVRDETPPAIRAEVLHARLFCLRGPDGLLERRVMGEELVDLAQREGLADAEFRGRTWLIPELLQVPDLPAYRAEVAGLETLAERTGQPLHQWYAELYRAQEALLVGDHGGARVRAERARRAGAAVGAPVAEVYHLSQEFLIRRDVGGLGELADELESVSARFPTFTTLRALLGLARLAQGRREQAVAEITRLAAHRFAAVPRDSLWITTVGLAAELAHAVGNRSAAEVAAQLLLPYAGTCAVQGLPACHGSVERPIGLGLAAAGHPIQARDHLVRARDRHRAWGFDALAVRSALDLARLDLSSTGIGPGALRAVGAELDGLAAEAVRRGWAALAEELRAQSDATSTVRPRRASGPGGTLSAREAEILGLVAEGLTNRQLAHRLVISVNTVERHVRNIYRKLDVANRAEAVAAHLKHDADLATDHGLP